MVKTKTSPTPLRQVYFGEKPILIEKNWKKWLGDPIKLEQQLKAWFEENAEIVKENKSLKGRLKDKDLEIKDLKNSFGAEKVNWTNEKANLENQIKTANLSSGTAWKQLENSREFAKNTYVYLGNYGTNPPLYSLDKLKWLLRKHDKPTVDKDYYTLYDLLEERKKYIWHLDEIKQLKATLETKRTELTNLGELLKQSWIVITDKNKTINNLELKVKQLKITNEKLTDSYKKLINHLADARQLVSHLQKDLSATQQDKEHIQQELHNALTILNKPTAEMGTQTDLTAEQITQMEQDLEYQRKLLYQGANEIDKLEKEISTLQTEIKDLQEQVKDKDWNEAEKELVNYYAKLRWIGSDEDVYNQASAFLQELKTGITPDKKWDWTQLRLEYKSIRKKLIQLAQNEIERIDSQKKAWKLSRELSQLQTKYDMEVRSKEELIRYLTVYRSQNNYLQYNENDKVGLKKFLIFALSMPSPTPLFFGGMEE